MSVARRRGGLGRDGPVVLVVIVVGAVTLSSTGYYAVAGPIAAAILIAHFYRQVRLNRALRAALSERFGFQVQGTPSLLRTAYFDAWCWRNGIDPRWSETVGVPDARRAVVFRRLGDYLVCSYSQMSTGAWRMNGEFARLKKPASDEELGQAVDRALDASVVGIAVPPATSPTPLEPLLRGIGVRSFAGILPKAAVVGVERLDGHVVVTPKRGGSRLGYVDVADDAQSIATPSAAAVGTSVTQALERTGR